MSSSELYTYGVNNPETDFSCELVDALLETDDIVDIISAGEDWSDHIVNKGDLLYKVIHPDADEQENYVDLYCQIGIHWSDDRYDDEVLNMIVEYGNTYHWHHVGKSWVDDRYDEVVLEKLLESRDCFVITDAICDWPEDRYDERMLDVIIEDGSWQNLRAILSKSLCNIGGFNDARVSAVNALFVKAAKANIKFSMFINENDIAIRNSNDVFIKSFARVLLKQNDAYALYKAGKDLPYYCFIPEIGYCLYKTGDERYIYMAARDWKEDRTKYIRDGSVGVVVSY